MKYLNKLSIFLGLLIGVLLIPMQQGLAQVDNDNCSNALDVGVLEFGTPNCFNTSNEGANAEQPYISQGTCLGDVAMPSSAADVWYQFTVGDQGNFLDIDIIYDTDTLVMALYEGTCDGLIGRECEVDFGGAIVNTTFSPIAPGTTYYLQVSGGSPTDQGDFEVCITAYGDFVDNGLCIIGQTVTVDPPPTLGSYEPGQTVTTCLTIEGYNQDAADWFHGLVPVFGEGWDVSTLTYVAPPACGDGSGGFWEWYDSVEGTASSATSAQGPGFFFETSSGSTSGVIDDNPGNNYGDSGSTGCFWEFCITVSTIATCPPGVNGDDLSITFLNFSDSETGSWDATSICPEDPDFTIKAVLACCAAPSISGVNPTCASPNSGSATATPGTVNAPFTFNWSNGFNETTDDVSVLEGVSAGFYSVTVTDDAGCAAAVSIDLTEEETTDEFIDIPVSVEECGLCAATADAPAEIHVIDADNTIIASFMITGCPETINLCLPSEGSFGLQHLDLIIENVVVDGVLEGDDAFTFLVGGSAAYVNIPVSATACGDCAASVDAPFNFNVIDSTGDVLESFSITACGDFISLCLPTDGNFGLQQANLSINDVIVDGTVMGDDAFTFVLSDAANAGTMAADLQIICAETSSTASTDGADLGYNYVSEEAGVLVYALHDSPTSTPGNIVAVNTDGAFSLNDGATPNEMYYISAVAGPDSDGDGVPDLDSGSCLSVAAGIPVVFLAPLTLHIDEYCDFVTGVYSVTGYITGGYPAYDNSMTYGVTGDYFDEVTHGVSPSFQFTKEDGSGTSYDIDVIDAFCGTTIERFDTFYCEKTPIELLRYTGKVTESGNLLQWTTATEIDNDYFTLERATDGNNFKTIATIKGAGDSYTEQSYDFLDDNAPNSLSYYRLTQTDFNGQQHSYGVVSLQRQARGFEVLNYGPMPVKEAVTLTYNSDNAATVAIKLYGVSGQLLYHNTTVATAGVNTLTIDMNNFSKGMYVLSLNDGTKVCTQKLVK